MDTAALLLEIIPLREIRTADIALKAGLSQATFYVYFENVEAIALALANRVTNESSSIMKYLDQDWSVPDVKPRIYDLVRAYLRFWQKNRAVMRIRNLASEEGDSRFLKARLDMSYPLHEALAERLAEARHYGGLESRANALLQATAGYIFGGLDHVASFSNLVELRDFGVTQKILIEAGVDIISAIIHDNAHVPAE